MNPNIAPIFADGKTTFSSVQDYAEAYGKYIKCNSNVLEVKQSAMQNNLCPSTDAPVVVNTISYSSNGTNSYGVDASVFTNHRVHADMTRLRDTISNKYTNVSNPPYSDYKKTNQQYDASLNALLYSYRGILENRANLDMRLKELYSGPRSISEMNKQEVDSVMYANILWTILATSMIYFIFMHL
jgi:hypothetical protein